MDISKTFVSVLSDERKSKNYSLRHVEEKTGVSSVVVHSWENGKQMPTLATISRIFNSGEFGQKVISKWMERISDELQLER